jgi:hypothetical protein
VETTDGSSYTNNYHSDWSNTKMSDFLKILNLPKDIYINMQKEVILGTCHLTRKFMYQ